MTTFQMTDLNNALIIGGGHGIGLALARQIKTLNPIANIAVTYRNPASADRLLEWQGKAQGVSAHQVDPTAEDDMTAFRERIYDPSDSLDLLINCVGILHDDTMSPEKSLRELSIPQLQQYFLINSCVTPILAKVFYSLFRNRNPSCFATLSAKVGSIADNQLGGWYGYRASKAALNMFLRNIAIEFQRRGCQTTVLAIHPGTTVTQLSKPFIGRTTLQLHSPEDTANNICRVLNGKSLAETGQFYSWDGTEIPW